MAETYQARERLSQPSAPALRKDAGNLELARTLSKYDEIATRAKIFLDYYESHLKAVVSNRTYIQTRAQEIGVEAARIAKTPGLTDLCGLHYIVLGAVSSRLDYLSKASDETLRILAVNQERAKNAELRVSGADSEDSAGDKYDEEEGHGDVDDTEVNIPIVGGED